MDAALAITQSALNASTTELDTAAQNIANVQTPGYAAETANLQALPGNFLGVGSGVDVTSISQATNLLLQSSNNQAQASLASLTSLQQVLAGAQNVFPLAQSQNAQGISTNSSIAGQLSSFWASWDTVAANPTSSGALQGVVNQAQNLVSSLNDAANQISQLTNNTESQLADNVSTANQLLSQIANLNGQIVSVKASGQSPAALVDQQNGALATLAGLVGSTTTTDAYGAVQVSINGVTVVQGTAAESLSASSTTTGGVTTWGVQTTSGIPVQVQSGSVAGLIAGLNTYIPKYLSGLNDVAANLASTVNGQLGSGYSTAGAPGTANPLFTGTTAATIAVSATVAATPSLLAVASTTGAAGANDGSNAQAMAELANSTTGPDTAYQGLVQQIGVDAQSTNQQMSAQSAVAQQTQAAYAAATGVNQNTEMANILTYQQDYQAAAKMLSVVQSTMQSLLAAVQ